MQVVSILPQKYIRDESYLDFRLRMFCRDGWRCQYPGCGRRKKLQLHHIIPRRLGGMTVARNVVAVCKVHHVVLDQLIH